MASHRPAYIDEPPPAALPAQPTPAGSAAEADRAARPGRRADAAVTALLLLLPGLLFRGAAGLCWWMSDDLAVLGFASRFRPWEYFFVPTVWRELPWRFMVQLQILTFDLDLALFGLDPGRFYLHHLLALGLAAAALYRVLRRWLALPSALFACLLFLLTPPLCTVAQQLMVRHYVEGLALAALAVGSFVAAVRRDSPLWAGVACLLALAASLAKEVYVPLPFLLVALPAGDLRSRLRRAAPAFAALLLHLGWRRWMLGEWTGGYGTSLGPGGWSALLPGLPGQLGASRFGLPAPAGWALLAAFLAAAAGLAAEGRASAARLAWTAGLVLAPVLPVAEKVAPRFLFLPVLFVAVVVVLGG